MYQIIATVIENQSLGSRYGRLVFSAPECADAAPGQFIEIWAQESGVLFRRPMSIAGVYGDALEIIYAVVGKGTRWISTLCKNQKVDIIGPLGNTFSTETRYDHIFFVAGGIGIAPLLFYAQHVQSSSGIPVTLFYGGKSSHDIILQDRIRALGCETVITTQDGSVGMRGVITDAVKKSLDAGLICRNAVIYACGPTPLLKAVAQIGELYALPTFVSLEEVMGCGFGVCLGCAVKIKDGYYQNAYDSYQYVCKDGPVFDARMIDWDNG